MFTHEDAVLISLSLFLGYIDLSKRRVSAEDVEKCTERFAKAKAVNSILRHVADILQFEVNEQLEELYQKTAWHFEEKYKSKAAAYDIFKQAVADPSLLDECGLEEKTRDVLLQNIRRKLTSQAVKIRADIECACYGYEGIDAVKTALRAGLELSTEELPIKINLIAPPLYVMTTSTPERADGLKVLESSIEKIQETITKLGGVFHVQMAVSRFFLFLFHFTLKQKFFLNINVYFLFFTFNSQKLLPQQTKLIWPAGWKELNKKMLKLLVTMMKRKRRRA